MSRRSSRPGPGPSYGTGVGGLAGLTMPERIHLKQVASGVAQRSLAPGLCPFPFRLQNLARFCVAARQ
jgi:hypothetical protein